MAAAPSLSSMEFSRFRSMEELAAGKDSNKTPGFELVKILRVGTDNDKTK
jgi:hypothetical protein